MPNICTRRSGKIKYKDGVATIVANEFTIYISVTSKQLRAVYWGKEGDCQVTIFEEP